MQLDLEVSPLQLSQLEEMRARPEFDALLSKKMYEIQRREDFDRKGVDLRTLALAEIDLEVK